MATNYDAIIDEANRQGHTPPLQREMRTGEIGELGPSLDEAVRYLRMLGMTKDEIDRLGDTPPGVGT
jgi:hypothetical protein